MSKRSRREKRRAKHGAPARGASGTGAAEGDAGSAPRANPTPRPEREPRRPAAPLRGDDALVAALDPGTGRVEWWVHVATALFVAFCALIAFLGLRVGGAAPIVAYRYGPTTLFLLSMATLAVGAFACFRRPPIRRKGRVRGIVMLALVIGIGSMPFPYPSSREREPSAVPFTLPVEGEWRVFWGGDDRAKNRYADWFADRRWGMALVREEGGATHTGDGAALADYHAWDRPVLAPARGIVAVVVDDVPDHAPGRRGDRGRPLGNHLAMEVAPGEFLFLTNLREGSIDRVVGETVEEGEVVARVGHSGLGTMVDEPHLALHLQTTPRARRGEAIPWTFRDYEADGRPVERGLPVGGIARDGRPIGQVVRRAGAGD